MANEGASAIEGFGGTVVSAADEAFDEERSIFNAMIDCRPAAIARCESADDVAAALAHGRRLGLEIAVRGGGHSVAGSGICDDGLVIDLRGLNSVEVDAEARSARVGGGAIWGEFDRACGPHSLATTGGRVSTTGVAGLTLGGGSGWLERKWGLACDNLTAVELVTADGERIRASEEENPELFWALHGGGGNFGVATELTFRLHDLPEFTGALLLWPGDRGAEITRTYRDLIEAGASDDLGGGLAYLTGPPEEFVPEHMHGQLCCGVIVAFAGNEAEAREAIAPILALEPEAQVLEEMPYAEFQCMIDDPPGYRNYWSVEHLTEFPDEALDRFCALAEEMIVPSPSQHLLVPFGGAVGRSAGSWPQPYRSTAWAVHPFGLWDDAADDQRGIAWARKVCDEMRDWASGAVYLNFTGDEGEDRVRAGFGEESYERMAAVKGTYDPENVFHLNHNIRPLAPA